MVRGGEFIGIPVPCSSRACPLKLKQKTRRAANLYMAIEEWHRHKTPGTPFAIRQYELEPGQWRVLQKQIQRKESWALRFPVIDRGDSDPLKGALGHEIIYVDGNVAASHLRRVLYSNNVAYRDISSQEFPGQVVYLLDNLSPKHRLSAVGLPSTETEPRYCPGCKERVFNVMSRHSDPDRSCFWCGAATRPSYARLGMTAFGRNVTDVLEEGGYRVPEGARITEGHDGFLSGKVERLDSDDEPG